MGVGKGITKESACIASDTEGKWQPEDGYDWINPHNLNDKSVRWVPGILSDPYPSCRCRRNRGSVETHGRLCMGSEPAPLGRHESDLVQHAARPEYRFVAVFVRPRTCRSGGIRTVVCQLERRLSPRCRLVGRTSKSVTRRHLQQPRCGDESAVYIRL